MSKKRGARKGKRGGETGLVPKLRFPEFRDESVWVVSYGNKLFDQINNRQATPGLPILAITQEHGAIPRDAIDYHVSVTDKSVETYKEVQPDDFIISLRSFQGGIEFSEYHGVCSPAYVILRKRTELSEVFFKYLFKSHRFIQQLTKNLEGLRDGKMISYRQFSELLLPNPTFDEQQKIADCLASINELVTLEAQKLDTLKAHKKGLMQQLFPAQGETVPKLRFPEFRDAGEWEVKKIEELAKRGSGHTPSKRKSHYYNGGIKWISLADSNKLDNRYIYETKVEISKEGLENSSAVLHPPGTVIISRDAGVGKSAILHSAMAVSQHFIAWLCDKSKLSNWFLYYFLQILKPKFEDIATGSTIQTIGLSYFKELCITIPSIQEQQKISSCLTSLDDLITTQTQKLDALKTHKKGLMQQLFPDTST